MVDTIIQGDALTVLKTLPDEFIDCCVTSPPYWGLRDYGVEGQLGLEKTPEEYVAKMVEVFREVRRVLRDDGVLFLNLGDSYYGSGKGGQSDKMKSDNWKPTYPRVNARRADACDTSGKEPVNYRVRDCLSKNLCGVCRTVYHHTTRTYDLLVPMLIASLSAPNLEHMGFGNGHLPTLDFYPRVAHIFPAIQEILKTGVRDDALLHVFQESMPDEFSRQLLALCLQRGNSSSCPVCGRSLIDNVRGYEHMLNDSPMQSLHNQGNEEHGDQQEHHNQYRDTAYGCYSENDSYYQPHFQPHCTTYKSISQILKPKDLVGIPWRVAFALQADGWWLRQDIIWAKPNPMPESVTDRCTKAHEYIFLLSKSARYYYDAEAVREDAPTYIRKASGYKGFEVTHTGNNQKGGFADKDTETNGRNKRSVWTITTKPFKEAHFATFPPKLIEPMILAGCPEGGIVLDPFIGSGTVARVAVEHRRHYIGIDLNTQYVEMAEKRRQVTQRMF